MRLRPFYPSETWGGKRCDRCDSWSKPIYLNPDDFETMKVLCKECYKKYQKGAITMRSKYENS